MENETEKIFDQQLAKLPREIITFLSSAPWEEDLGEIGELYNLTKKELDSFKREASLVVLGIVHPDAFGAMLEQEVGLEGAVLEAVVLNVEKKIFGPIRPALISFFEKEASESEMLTSKSLRQRRELASSEFANSKSKDEKDSRGIYSNIPRKPDVAPDNLPTDESAESLIPLIPLKFGDEEKDTSTHPFEEKMKKVFTAGQQSLGDLAIEPPAPTAPPTKSPKAPPIYNADPYREPIE